MFSTIDRSIVYEVGTDITENDINEDTKKIMMEVIQLIQKFVIKGVSNKYITIWNHKEKIYNK
jgi:hypothetical protein